MLDQTNRERETDRQIDRVRDRQTENYEEITSNLTNSLHGNSFIQAISVAPLQLRYYSEALPTQHRYGAGVNMPKRYRLL